jgi:hypothetical protein
MASLTVTELAEDLLAIAAFVSLAFFPGYLIAWSSDLCEFRRRSFVERVCWSIPLSFALTTIASVLISRFLSLTAAGVLLFALSVLAVALIISESLQRRRAFRAWNSGWSHEATLAMVWAAAWTVLALVSLVDFPWHGRVYMSATIVDVGTRVNWIESILRTGVPPANPLYQYLHPAHLRQYYFWYVDCAVVARMCRLPARAVLTASCVWSGYGLAALLALYLKYFLDAGAQLRRQFLACLALLAVTGLDVLALAGCIFLLQRPLPLDLEWWSADQITSWIDSLFWAPHHVAALVGCLLAFMLASLPAAKSRAAGILRILFIGACLASGFGLSIYVTFAFFLLMLQWAVWQIIFERQILPAVRLACGGALSLVLLIPYLLELRQGTSGTQGGRSTHLFALAVREMIPVDPFLATHFLQPLASTHPILARNFLNLVLLIPGYTLELGFYLIVLLVYLVPAWRPRRSLTPGERTLLFLSVATLPIITFLRSAIISQNDFGWRSALFLQFPMLLFGAVLWTSWHPDNSESSASVPSPQWLRSLASLAILIGVLSSVTQALGLRFGIPLVESESRGRRLDATRMSDVAAIASSGYSQLDRTIPRDAIVQFNPEIENRVLATIEQLNVQRQVAIAGDTEGCGSAVGGDPNGCVIMAAALDAVFRSASADQARGVCRQFGIQYLIANVYDPAWNGREGWVWTLPAVVADPRFRVLDCR